MTSVEKYRRYRENQRELYKSVTFTLRRTEVEKIAEIAQNMGISKAEFLRRAVNFYIAEEGGETKFPPG